STVEPSVAGPKRPQDRVSLRDAGRSFTAALPSLLAPGASPSPPKSGDLTHGSVVIAAITSCTNTSNPSVMIAAGLLAKKAVERAGGLPAKRGGGGGLAGNLGEKPAPPRGPRVAPKYYRHSGLDQYLEKLKFHTVGYGCTTCIGNSGPLPADISKAIEDRKL